MHWLLVQCEVAHFARAVSYDPAGVGGSEPGPPVALDHSVDELHQLLQRGAIRPPSLLVGHSYGGLLVRVYAQQHPEHVSGLVLVDATPGAAADDPGVRMGFSVLGITARLARLLSPFGIARLLLRAGVLVPEQARLRHALSSEEYQRWEADVCRTFASTTGSELQVVIPVTRAAQQVRAGVVDRNSGTCRWAYSPATPSATGGSSGSGAWRRARGGASCGSPTRRPTTSTCATPSWWSRPSATSSGWHGRDPSSRPVAFRHADHYS